MLFKIACVLFVAALAAAGVQTWRIAQYQDTIAQMELDASNARADALQAAEDAQLKARRIQRAMYQAKQEAAESYAQGVSDAKHKAEAIITGLRNGNLRLRDYWTECKADIDGMRGDSGSTSDASTTDERRTEAAAAIVRVGAECDAKLKGWRQFYKGLRNQ